MRQEIPEIIELPRPGVDSGHCALITDKEPDKMTKSKDIK